MLTEDPKSKKPNKSVADAPSRLDDLSVNAHRQLIGYIGLTLPFLLILIALARDGAAQWRNLRLDQRLLLHGRGGRICRHVGLTVAVPVHLSRL